MRIYGWNANIRNNTNTHARCVRKCWLTDKTNALALRCVRVRERLKTHKTIYVCCNGVQSSRALNGGFVVCARAMSLLAVY